MGILLSNWQYIAIAILAALATLFANLWQGEVKDFAEFKGAIVVLGQEAEKEAKRVNDLHVATLKETNDEWTKALPKVGANAVDNYMRRFPRGLCASAPSSGTMPSNANSTETPNGAVGERVVAGESGLTPEQDAFVKACGKDAAKLKSLRGWVQGNKLPIEK